MNLNKIIFRQLICHFFLSELYFNRKCRLEDSSWFPLTRQFFPTKTFADKFFPNNLFRQIILRQSFPNPISFSQWIPDVTYPLRIRLNSNVRLAHYESKQYKDINKGNSKWKMQIKFRKNHKNKLNTLNCQLIFIYL